MNFNEKQLIINRKKLVLDAGFLEVSELAIEINETTQAVSAVIRGSSKNLRVQRLVAHKLGKTLAEMWPELYGPLSYAGESDASAQCEESLNAV